VFERGREAGRFEREDEYPTGPRRRAAIGGMEGGQALGLDLQKVSRHYYILSKWQRS
jgi:hypothetical protein